MRIPSHCIHPWYSIEIGKRPASRYHPSRLCKGIRISSTPPLSTQVRILWRQPQNQQMDSLVPREQKAERNTWRDCLQASSITLWCTTRYSSWTSTVPGLPQRQARNSNFIRDQIICRWLAFFTVQLTTRLTVTYCRGTLQF
jgi:hypothetical protein